MPVSLKLYASLSALTPENAAAYPVSPGDTVGAIMEALGIHAGEAVSIVRNGHAAEPDTPVFDGDRIAFVPPVGGG